MRLDKYVASKGYATSRSQAEQLVKRGEVVVDGKIIKKPGHMVTEKSVVNVRSSQQYVSRAALKLASVVGDFNVDFTGKTVLDVGSSTGGFTDYALQHGAKKVIAVDVGTEQLHPRLREDRRIALHEKTDIRDFQPQERPDIILIDVSFISILKILPSVLGFAHDKTVIIAMAKPQFESSSSDLLHKGIVKNNRYRREILRQFEQSVRKHCVIKGSSDSAVAGEKGNIERFYLLKPIR